jgi:ankyrin repeat protein
MRLLRLDDDDSFSLVEYLGSDAVPAYAILSHTWGSDHEEVTFRDLIELATTAKAKAGYRKITFCASRAARDGLRYFWVDTCCINKSDAAELQEAINSMFRWYQNATRCYVYLSDVSKEPSTSDDRSQRWKPEFRQSRWFTRGWTLQELIAPKSVELFSIEGTLLGNKHSLEQTIQEITGIAVHAIRGDSLSQFSEEEILSWVVERQTKRKEDIVYCLFGFFGIFMPLLYGEGRQNALKRLQEQTRKKSDHNVQSLRTEQRQMLKDSLQFDQIDARHMTIKNAHARTCKWFLECPEYLQWLDHTRLDNHHGFLWIKGNPGTGKSTLMKFAAAHARRIRADREVVSFFFNARGEHLERSTVGAYRSILFQLLERSPRLLRVFDSLTYSTSRISTEYDWKIGALETLLEEALGMLERPTVCYIDALDECDENSIREMIAFFERIGELSASSKVRFQICFSSRHYPHITIERGIDLVLEGQEGHDQDITKYIQDKLRIGKSKQAQQIHTELQQKASGIFMWVVLVVEILNKEHDDGQNHALQQRLQEIPSDLHKLFRNILTRDSEKRERLLLCIQWVLFSAKPLSPVELYYAIRSGLEPNAPSVWDQDEVTPDAIEKFILGSSKGLTDITASKAQKVQFIHESVRDFLLKGNTLSDIWPELANNFHGTSHEALKQCCLKFLELENPVSPEATQRAQSQLGSLAENMVNGVTKARARKDAERLAKKTEKEAKEKLSQATIEKYPFLPYSVNNVLHHANAAEGYGITQNNLGHFPLDRWIEFNNLFEKHEVRKYTKDVTLLYLLAERNLKSLIKVSPSISDCLEVGNERYGSAMFASFVCKSVDATQLFVEALGSHSSSAGPIDYSSIPKEDEQHDHVSRRTFKYHRRKSILLNAVELGDIMFFALILDIGRNLVDLEDLYGRTPLWYAAKYGEIAMVKLLLATGEVRVDGHPSSEGTPLSAAIKRTKAERIGLFLSAKADANTERNFRNSSFRLLPKSRHEAVVKLLLDAGAKMNDTRSTYSNALREASENGDGELVRLFLNAGADVNGEGVLSSPLHEASTKGHKEVVELLLSAGANVNAQDRALCTPLQEASGQGYKEVVELLLHAGADVNLKDHIDRLALHRASGNGYKEVVELLLRAGADVNAQCSSRDTPLYKASTQGNKEMVELLLRAGADVNARCNSQGTPLHEASTRGNKEMVELLLRAGAEVNAKDALGNTSLQAASMNGCKEVVELLLRAGAEVNAKDALGNTSLQAASMNGCKEVVELLLRAGADVNGPDRTEGTPLRLASMRGHEEVVKLLLSAGADMNTQGSTQPTALQLASAYDHKEVVGLLLSAGADVNACNGTLGTAMQEASERGNKEMVELLKNAGADDSLVSNDSQPFLPIYETEYHGAPVFESNFPFDF